MIESAELRTDDEKEARAAVGLPLSSDQPDLICVGVAREEAHPTAQAKPEPRPDPKDPRRTIQDPAPDPLPGKVSWVMHYERRAAAPTPAKKDK